MWCSFVICNPQSWLALLNSAWCHLLKFGDIQQFSSRWISHRKVDLYSHFKWPYEYIHYMKFAILCAKTYHSAQHVQSQSIFNYLLIKSCLLVFAKKTVGICILILVKNWRLPWHFFAEIFIIILHPGIEPSSAGWSGMCGCASQPPRFKSSSPWIWVPITSS